MLNNLEDLYKIRVLVKIEEAILEGNKKEYERLLSHLYQEMMEERRKKGDVK